MSNDAIQQHGHDMGSFRNRFGSAICAVDCDAVGSSAAFSTCFESVGLGVADVYRYHGQSLRTATRSAKHIEADPVDDFLVLLPVNIPFELQQVGNRSLIEPGKFVFVNTSKPFEGFCGRPAQDVYSELKVKISASLLRQKVPHIDRCCALPIAAHEGAGPVIETLIGSILAQGPSLSNFQARMFGMMLVNMIGMAALEASEFKDMAVSSRELSHARVRLMAQEFIECNLSDPELDCDMIARHCHVSLRHLHASFDSATTTVGSVIRELRLQHCRDELRNPVLKNKSIIQIAMKWGYTSSAGFTRAYRERFGASPSDDRQSLALLN